MADTKKRWLPYIVGGDIIVIIDGKSSTDVFPTTTELNAGFHIETIVNKAPNLFPNRDVQDRKVLAYQQGIQEAGGRPPIDGTLDVYSGDPVFYDMFDKMIEYMDGTAGCFGFVRYERATDRTCWVNATTDEIYSNVDGTAGDDNILSLPLWNKQEAVYKKGNLFEEVLP